MSTLQSQRYPKVHTRTIRILIRDKAVSVVDSLQKKRNLQAVTQSGAG